jgi:hypothetical protein
VPDIVSAIVDRYRERTAGEVTEGSTGAGEP